METVDDIITDILKAEGWDTYTDDPADRGGPTKWGITLQAWRDAKEDQTLTADDVKAITEEEARTVYWWKYIKEPGFDKLPVLIMPLVVDCGVNHGTTRAAKWLQRVVGAKMDGVVGPKTIKAVKQMSQTVIYLRLCAHRVRFYGRLVSLDHTQARFASGWNNRAAKHVDRLADMLAGV